MSNTNCFNSPLVERFMHHLFGDEGKHAGGNFPKVVILGRTKHVTKCQNCGREGLKETVVCARVGEDGHPTREYFYFGTDCASKIAGKSEKEVDAEADDQESKGRPRVAKPKSVKPNEGQQELALRFQAAMNAAFVERFAAKQQPAKEPWQMSKAEAAKAGHGDAWSSIVGRAIKRGDAVPDAVRAEFDSHVKAYDERVKPKSEESPAPKIGDKLIRFTHKDGTGLLNNSGLDRSKLTDEEEQELVSLMDFGLRQPPHGTNGTFHFTEAGEKRHARMLQLLSKASKTGVVRSESTLQAEPNWVSDDGQIAVQPAAGQPVPAHVLEDYPDLQPAAATDLLGQPVKPAPKQKAVFDSNKGKQQSLFAGLNAKEGQMNLFADDGVPDELVAKPQPPAQKELFEAVREALVERYAAQQSPWYLKSNQLLAQKMGHAAPANQVLAMLRNNQISPEELRYTGLEQHLQSKGNQPVSQQELQAMIGKFGISEHLVAKPRYKHVQGRPLILPGGKNYQELLLTLPHKEPEILYKTGDDIRAKAKEFENFGWSREDIGEAAKFVDQAGSVDGGWRLQDRLISQGYGFTPSQRAAGGILRSILSGHRKRVEESRKDQYRSHHWQEPNVLAHIRYQDFVGPDGKKHLHVDEIQSDWHQQGAKKGYYDSEKASRKLEDLSRDELNQILIANDRNGDFDGVSRREALQIIRNWQEEDPGFDVGSFLRNRASTDGVPDAPFKKNWHALSMKRILHHAAANGYDRVTWTPGQEQADRYNLSRHVHSVSYRPETSKFLVTEKGGQKVLQGKVVNGKYHQPGHQLHGSPLHDIIGGELTGRLLSSKPGRDGWVSLSGDGLSFGGEFHKTLYDQKLPEVAHKLIKPHGGMVRQFDLHLPEVGDSEGYDPGHVPERSIKVHGFDITPQLRESVIGKGQSLFSVFGDEDLAVDRYATQREPNRWYLKSLDLLNQKMGNVAPASQVLSLLRNNQVSPDELQWTGLEQHLLSRGNNPVTKQELMNLASRMQIHETVKADMKNAPVLYDESLPEPYPVYQNYTLQGGKNYREVLLRLPHPEPSDEEKRRWWESQPGNKASYDMLSDVHKKGLAERMRDRSKEYKSSHWGEPNVLAHVRHQDFVGPDGKRHLHIEEIQSDWHQQGRKKGYATPPSIEIKPGQIDGKTVFTIYVNGRAGLSYETQEAAQRYARSQPGAGEIPDAPFKNSWRMLAMKRMIDHAVRNGYDRITWTPGQEQADRYPGLQDEVKYVSALKKPDGQYLTYLETPEGRYSKNKHGFGLYGQGSFTHEQLAELFGHHTAQQLVQGADAKASKQEWHDLHPSAATGHPEGLKIGGHKMRKAYDEILPQETARLIKKHGGKVGQFDLHIHDQFHDSDGMPTSTAPRAMKVHGFDITPQMKQAVLSKGQSLFSLFGDDTWTVDRYENTEPKPAAAEGQLDSHIHWEMPEFKSWFGKSKAVTPAGKPLRLFHGTKRPDRIGAEFKASRATSGPMAFFTDDPAIASNYATGKQDTSIDMPESYSHWFKYKVPGSKREVDLDSAWHHLPPEQRKLAMERLPHVNLDDEGNISHKHGQGTVADGWDYYLKREGGGNPLKAARYLWLDSGHLFNDEHRFLEVLKHAGIDHNQFRLDSPWHEQPGVYPVWLSIQNPLDTGNIPDRVHTALHLAGRLKRGKAGDGADQWDKRHVSGPEWLDRLASDRQQGTTHAWTSIPDWVTKTLRSFGYDGIQDRGGKYTNHGHNVWIPFSPHQIKSAVGNRGTFDSGKKKIIYASDGQPERFQAPARNQHGFVSFRLGAGMQPPNPPEPPKKPSNKLVEKIRAAIAKLKPPAVEESEKKELFGVARRVADVLSERCAQRNNDVGIELASDWTGERFGWDSPQEPYGGPLEAARQSKKLTFGERIARQLLGNRAKGVSVREAIIPVKRGKRFGSILEAKLSKDPAKHAQEIGALAQRYRDPRYETFRAIYLRGNQVVGVNAITHRHPSLVGFGPQIANMYHDAHRLQADNVWLTHNHPSGNAHPSDTDHRATYRIYKLFEEWNDLVKAKGVPHQVKLAGHVITNHDHFTHFSPFQSFGDFERVNLKKPGKILTKHVHDGVKSDRMGREVLGPIDVANMAWNIHKNPHQAVVAMVNAKHHLKALLDVDAKHLTHEDPKMGLQTLGALRRMHRQLGTTAAFLFLPPGMRAEHINHNIRAHGGFLDMVEHNVPTTVGAKIASQPSHDLMDVYARAKHPITSRARAMKPESLRDKFAAEWESSVERYFMANFQKWADKQAGKIGDAAAAVNQAGEKLHSQLDEWVSRPGTLRGKATAAIDNTVGKLMGPKPAQLPYSPIAATVQPGTSVWINGEHKLNEGEILPHMTRGKLVEATDGDHARVEINGRHFHLPKKNLYYAFDPNAGPVAGRVRDWAAAATRINKKPASAESQPTQQAEAEQPTSQKPPENSKHDTMELHSHELQPGDIIHQTNAEGKRISIQLTEVGNRGSRLRGNRVIFNPHAENNVESTNEQHEIRGTEKTEFGTTQNKKFTASRLKTSSPPGSELDHDPDLVKALIQNGVGPDAALKQAKEQFAIQEKEKADKAKDREKAQATDASAADSPASNPKIDQERRNQLLQSHSRPNSNRPPLHHVTRDDFVGSDGEKSGVFVINRATNQVALLYNGQRYPVTLRPSELVDGTLKRSKFIRERIHREEAKKAYIAGKELPEHTADLYEQQLPTWAREKANPQSGGIATQGEKGQQLLSYNKSGPGGTGRSEAPRPETPDFDRLAKQQLAAVEPALDPANPVNDLSNPANAQPPEGDGNAAQMKSRNLIKVDAGVRGALKEVAEGTRANKYQLEHAIHDQYPDARPELLQLLKNHIVSHFSGELQTIRSMEATREKIRQNLPKGNTREGRRLMQMVKAGTDLPSISQFLPGYDTLADSLAKQYPSYFAGEDRDRKVLDFIFKKDFGKRSKDTLVEEFLNAMPPDYLDAITHMYEDPASFSVITLPDVRMDFDREDHQRWNDDNRVPFGVNSKEAFVERFSTAWKSGADFDDKAKAIRVSNVVTGSRVASAVRKAFLVGRLDRRAKDRNS